MSRNQPAVFISHSHEDRDNAIYLQDVLHQHGAKTILDQDYISVGDELSPKIVDGITRCECLLLLWSASAINSDWVNKELKFAWDLRKPIIPYKLDNTDLPPGPDRLVFVTMADQEHSNAEFLKAIFGKEFRPIDPTELFPGKWRAEVTVPGLRGMSSIYEMELRPNGQIFGTFGMPTGGGLEGMMDQLGLRDFLGSIPFKGTWSYDRKSGYLILNVVSQIMGQQASDTIRIKASGTERGVIRGSDGGKNYSLQRTD